MYQLLLISTNPGYINPQAVLLGGYHKKVLDDMTIGGVSP